MAKKMDKLSQDSCAAVAAGMSYGKYMAMKNPVKIEKSQPERNGKKYVCKCCGEVFYRTMNYEYQFCSEKCRGKWQKIKDREDKAATKCAVCGNVFIPRSVTSKYCSDECRMVAQGEAARRTNQKRRDAKVKQPKTCVYCGKEFMPEHMGTRCCTPFCRQLAQNDQHKEYQRRRMERKCDVI